MKSISIYLSIFLSIFILHNALGQDGGDAVYNKLIKEYTLKGDGSTEYREYKEIKLLSHMSFHRLYGETFIIYDPKFQELKINDAYTIMADGKKVVVPDNAYNEVLPRAAAHAAPYNHLREMVITHTGLEVGATIYLDYTLLSKPGYMQTFMGEEVIQDIVPIKEKKILIHIPEDKELHFKMLNIRTAPEISADNGVKTYSFSFNAMSGSTQEWGTDASLLPRLFFSTAKDLERAYFPFVGQKAFTLQLNQSMKNAVSKLKEENEAGLDLALAIQKMVINDIGRWRLSLEHTGFKCRTPEEVWASNAGTDLEKTVLLTSLLQEAGFRTAAYAIIPDRYYDKSVGSLYVMKGFAVQLRLEGEDIYLSAIHQQNQDLAFGLNNTKLLILDGAIESIRAINPVSLKTEIIYQGKFVNDENEKIKGKMSVKLVGSANPYFGLLQDTAYAKKYAKGVQEVKLNILNHNESAFDLDIIQKNVFKEYGDYIFMGPPLSNNGVSSWGISYIETGRRSPIKLKELITEKYYYTIELPDGYQLVSPSIDINIENVIGSVKISLKQEGNVIHANREIQINKLMVGYSEFDAFSEIIEAWMNPSLQEIIFKK